MNMNNILLVGLGGMIGYYLAINKRKQVESALNRAEAKARDLAKQLEAELKEGDRLAGKLVSEDVQRDGL